MNPVLQVFFIICIVVFLALIIRYISKQRLNLKYSLVWLAAGVGMLILAFFPGLVDKLGALVGIASPVSTVFLFAGMFMLAIIFTLTIIVSHMNQRIYRLTQNQALLEKRIRDMENGKNNTGGGYSQDV